MTLGVALMFGVLGVAFIAFGRSDRGQGRVLAALWQGWGGGLILLALLGFVLGAEADLPVVAASAWFLGGIVVIVAADILMDGGRLLARRRQR